MTATSSLAYVFDFGRVVFRWRPDVLVATTLAHRITPETDVAHWVGQVFQGYQGDWEAFDRGLVDVPELARRIARRTGLAEADVHALVAGCLAELEPVPAMVDWIERLHAQGRPLHFLSNMPEEFAAHFEAAHAVMRRFDSGVFSARVNMVKPEPGIYAHAARVFGHAPADLLFFDDHLPNVIAAREAGWRAVHFVDAAQAQADAAALGG